MRCLVRTTVSIDDELFRTAMALAEPGLDKGDLLREALAVFVRVQTGKRLAALGGRGPGMQNVPRRRPEEQSPQ